MFILCNVKFLARLIFNGPWINGINLGKYLFLQHNKIQFSFFALTIPLENCSLPFIKAKFSKKAGWKSCRHGNYYYIFQVCYSVSHNPCPIRCCNMPAELTWFYFDLLFPRCGIPESSFNVSAPNGEHNNPCLKGQIF